MKSGLSFLCDIMELKSKQEQHLRKSVVACATQHGDALLKMLKYFEVMLNIFEFFECEKLYNLDWSKQMSFFERPNQTS